MPVVRATTFDRFITASSTFYHSCVLVRWPCHHLSTQVAKFTRFNRFLEIHLMCIFIFLGTLKKKKKITSHCDGNQAYNAHGSFLSFYSVLRWFPQVWNNLMELDWHDIKGDIMGNSLILSLASSCPILYTIYCAWKLTKGSVKSKLGTYPGSLSFPPIAVGPASSKKCGLFFYWHPKNLRP